MIVLKRLRIIWMVMYIVMDGKIKFEVMMIIYMKIMIQLRIVKENLNEMEMEKMGEVDGKDY